MVSDKAQEIRENLKKERQKKAVLDELVQEIGEPDGRIREDASGSQSVSEASGSVVKFSDVANSTLGTAFQDARREISHNPTIGGIVTGGNGRNRGNRRSIESLDIRPRPINRRPDESNSSVARSSRNTGENEQPAATIGRLETSETVLRPDETQANFTPTRQSDGAIPIAQEIEQYYKENYKYNRKLKKFVRTDNEADEIGSEEYDKLPSRKSIEDAEEQAREQAEKQQKSEENKQKWYKQNGVLSSKEAEELYEPLREALKDDGRYLDEAIQLYNRQWDRPIWGDIDDDETEIVARMMLKQAQKSEKMAFVVRTTVELNSYFAAIAIFAPRIALTAEAIRSAPPRNRRKFTLFRQGE